ncbi:heme oxygenase-like protein [Exidia glandulosa HHB12029]|uniref:Heme oxygenase-like protein n=1 Tax=Exidia glandulosa HHB12029 TaxID=1314781 RepID=A0A165PCZ9_EXIGL|nr:heme oxygenase-like protein [Exidia glandulosa HHB12029]
MSTIDVALPCRILGAMSQVDADLNDATAFRGHYTPRSGELDFVDTLIAANRDVWDKLVHHPFAASIASNTASLDGYRYYTLQDRLFLINYVRYILGRLRKAPFEAIRAAAENDQLKKNIGYVDCHTEILRRHLGVDETEISNVESHVDLDRFCTFLDECLREDGWVTLHIVMIPCVVGYYQIANRLLKDEATVRDTVFFETWIRPNASPDSATRLRAFCDYNCTDVDADLRRRWETLFRTACEMEMSIFNLLFSTTSTPKERL